MEKKRGASELRQFAGKALLIEGVIFALTGLISYLQGSLTAYDYGGRLFLAGVVILVVGYGVVTVNWGLGRRFEYRYGLSASDQVLHPWTEQEQKDTGAAYRFFIQATIVGLIPILAGSLLQSLGR